MPYETRIGMVSQAILIGIAVGVFFAGLGIGYAVLQSSTPAMPMMMPQQMQQMMNNPQTMNQWHQQMMQDPQAMSQWMNTMMNDPTLRQQMYSQMMQHQQFMQGMMNNQQFQNQWMGPMMDQGMMGPGMMGWQGSASSQALPSDAEPQTRTFDIILDEVEFFAHVENEQGEEETALVELHQWNPNLIVVNQGDTVVLNISNPRKNSHTFTIPEFGVTTKVLDPRTGSETIQFVADKAGVFTFACGLPYNAANGQCDPDHSMMTGTLIVLE